MAIFGNINRIPIVSTPKKQTVKKYRISIYLKTMKIHVLRVGIRSSHAEYTAYSVKNANS